MDRGTYPGIPTASDKGAMKMRQDVTDSLLVEKIDEAIHAMKSTATRELVADYPIQTIRPDEFEDWFAQLFEKIADARPDFLEPAIARLDAAFCYLFDLGEQIRKRYGEKDKTKRIFTAFTEWYASHYSGWHIRMLPSWHRGEQGYVISVEDFVRMRVRSILYRRDTDPVHQRAEFVYPDDLARILAGPFYDDTWQVAQFKKFFLDSPARSGFSPSLTECVFWEWDE